MGVLYRGTALAATLCSLGSILCAQTQPRARAHNRSEATKQDASSSHTDILRQLDEAMDEVAERVLPAIVQISVSGFGPSHQQRSGESVIERQRGIGSGVIVDPNGYIITNAHVIAGAQRIQVVMVSVTTELVPFKTSLLHRQRTFEAKLIGLHQLTDLALLKI